MSNTMMSKTVKSIQDIPEVVFSVDIGVIVLLLEAMVDVEVENVLIVVFEELPCTVVVEYVLASEEVVLLEYDVVVKLEVVGFELVDDVA